VAAAPSTGGDETMKSVVGARARRSILKHAADLHSSTSTLTIASTRLASTMEMWDLQLAESG
jgi:hypothetical protein